MGAFAKAANELMAAAQPPAWEQRLAKQKADLYSMVPSSEMEAQTAAATNLKRVSDIAYNLGYTLRQKRQKSVFGGEDMAGMLNVPSKFHVEPFHGGEEPKQAGILSAIGSPMLEQMQDWRAEAARTVDEKLSRATRTTSNPGTIPTHYAAMATAAPRQFISGYRKAETDLDVSIKQKLDERIEGARQAFEKAMREEYRNSRGMGKASSAGEFIDGLAQAHVKLADGELNQLLGGYLALASLLGEGSHFLMERAMTKRDPRLQRARAIKELITQRQIAEPPVIHLAPASNELVGEEEPTK